MAAWEAGWYWLEAGASDTFWISWGDTWQGLQFIAAEPRPTQENRMDVIGQAFAQYRDLARRPLCPTG